jgi:uncharacterized membrane protein
MPWLSFLIGFFAGLRSLMAPAVTAWAVHLGWIALDGWLALIGSLPAVLLLSLLAIGELVADKLPSTPSRTAALGLTGRILTGALTGACVAAGAGQSAVFGAILGVGGGLVGCFAGYQARIRTARAFGVGDLPVALLEDAIAIAGALWVVTRLS